MLDGVATAVYAGAFAVPDAKDAIIFTAGPQVDLLRAPNGGQGQILVQTWLELDMAAFEKA